jgi:nicotinate phosphoribosyltransferase
VPSILATDGYKFSMAQVGFPLRRETFYFCFRRGGWHYNPFDLEARVRALLPAPATEDEYAYLAANNYRLTEAMRQAIRGDIEIRAIPAGTWFGDQEPILSVTGPSFLVSWLETQLTWLNYPLQLATWLERTKGTELANEPITVVCDEHEEVVRETLDLAKKERRIERDATYAERTLDAARNLVAALDGGEVDLRLIEGGMRSALCMAHHRIVLEACKEVGLTRTSNVHVARQLDLVPSGTAGHEHTQRCLSDRAAYGNYLDRVCGLVSCLSDTFSTLGSGLPETLRIAREHPERDFLFRLDSGDRAAYFHVAANGFARAGVENVRINVAGDMDATSIAALESLRKLVKWEPNRLSYMVGGGLTAQTLPTSLTRSRVAAVYKLCQTGTQPTMKLGDEEGVGKRSVPGVPVTWRRLRGDGPVGIIGQAGEAPPEDYVVLTDNPEAGETLRVISAVPRRHDGELRWGAHPIPYELSPASRALVEKLERTFRRSGVEDGGGRS